MTETETSTTDDAGEEVPDESGFTQRVLASFREMFWDPEIERRGGLEATGPIVSAIAILKPGAPVEIRLNEECEVVARARADYPVNSGDPVTIENLEAIESLEPVGVDPDAGWVMLAVLPDGRQYARFDLTRNRGRSRRLLSLSHEYLSTAREAAQRGRSGPAIENAMAAAELAVEARVYTLEAAPASGKRRNAHSTRLHWTKVHVGLGNTVSTAHSTLRELNSLRGAARYGEGPLPDHKQVEALLLAVEELIEDADARIGPLLRTQESS